MFIRDEVKRSKTVKYRQEQSRCIDDTPVSWTIEHAGSYAPGWEHQRYLTVLVRSAGFSLINKGNGWVVKGIVIETEAAPGSAGSIILTVDPDAAMPRWLSDLAYRAEND